MTISSHYPRSRNSGLTNKGLVLVSHNTIAVNIAHPDGWLFGEAWFAIQTTFTWHQCSNAHSQNNAFWLTLSRPTTTRGLRLHNINETQYDHCRNIAVRTFL